MKKLALSAFMAVMTVAAANADVTVNFKQTPQSGNAIVTHIPVSAFTKSRAERRKATVTDTISFQGNKLVLPLAAEDSQYIINVDDADFGFFAAPGDNVVFEVASITPLVYTMKGTELLEGIQAMNEKISPINDKIKELRDRKDLDKDALRKELEPLYESMTKVYADYIAENPNSTATPYAVINLDREDLVNAFDNLSEGAKKSILMPLATAQYESAKKRLEMERKQQALQNGDVDAPTFTLKNPEGKNVSLSDFKGKWVILDFWGTWCPWCIKGFPALKEAYAKYAGKLEVIGIDCGDTVEKWKDGIQKYSLPWVHVYKPQDNNVVTDEYFVTGYPTKVIVNPEGKVANITVGENPDFFNVLAGLIGE